MQKFTFLNVPDSLCDCFSRPKKKITGFSRVIIQFKVRRSGKTVNRITKQPWKSRQVLRGSFQTGRLSITALRQTRARSGRRGVAES